MVFFMVFHYALPSNSLSGIHLQAGILQRHAG